MKKIIKTLASLYQTDTPFTHVLEVFSQIQSNYDVELITFNTPDKSKIAEDVKLRQVPFTQHKIPLLRGFLYEFYTILYILTSKNTQIIYDRLRPFGFAAYIIYKLKKIPVIVEVNGIVVDECLMANNSRSILNTLHLKAISSIERKLFSISHKIISVTPNIKKKLQEIYDIPENKIIVIENGANPELFRPIDQENAREKLKLEKNFKYIGFVGSFAPWQGLEFLIHASKLIQNEFSDVKFLIVGGEGTEKDEIVKLVEKLNLKDKFIFTGMVPYGEVPWYINASDVCIVYKKPLESGYSPLKLYEYMACGKPVIASKVSGFEILEKGNAGILVEPENPELLAKAILKLLKDEDLIKKMGKNGRTYLIENNSWAAVAKRIEKILEDVPDV